MSFYLINVVRSENDYVTGIPTVYGHYECDTFADLPAQNQTTYKIGIGSTAHIIDTNAEYAITSGGTWYVQETGTDVYTKSQIDSMLSGKADTATTLAGYGITNAYTKTQTDNLLLPKITISDVFGVGNNTYIPDGSNMNDYTSAGVFIRQFSTGLADFTNLPMNGSTYQYQPFKLVVEYLNSPNNILQTIIPTYTTCGYFKRMRVFGASGSWYPWKYFEGV